MIKGYREFNEGLFREFNKPKVNIEYHDNGQKRSEIWYLTGKHQIEHREDGPAYQGWYENGQKFDKNWYLNDEEYSREEWIKKLKKIGSPHYEEQKMLYDAEKYNL